MKKIILLSIGIIFSVIAYSQQTWMLKDGNVELYSPASNVAIGMGATSFKLSVGGDAYFTGMIKFLYNYHIPVVISNKTAGFGIKVPARTPIFVLSDSTCYVTKIELSPIQTVNYMLASPSRYISFNSPGSGTFPGFGTSHVTAAYGDHTHAIYELKGDTGVNKGLAGYFTTTAALALKAPLASPTFTGTIGGKYVLVDSTSFKYIKMTTVTGADTAYKRTGMVMLGTDLYWGNGTRYKKIN